LTLWAGTLPIVFSAPHGGREALPGVAARRGTGVTQFVTGRDTRTDELAEAIVAKLAQRLGGRPHLVLARFERKYVDVNRPSSDAYESENAKIYYDGYHSALTEACRRVRAEWGRGLLLDIHGEGSESDAIFRGTNNGQTVESLTRKFGIEALNGSRSVVGQLKQKGYKVFPLNGTEKEQRYSGGFIVRSYGSHTADGIDAMQLEFGSALRGRALLERTANDVADAISVFAQAYLPVK
jgi:N-formylglutamate amidohydrolase